MRLILSLSLLSLVVVGCSSSEKRPEERVEQKTPVSMNPAPDAGASMESKQVAAEMNAPFATEIRFAKNSYVLSAESKGRLKKIASQAKRVGAIDQIEAYVWSDEEYPGKATKKLEPAEQNLADSRGLAIKEYYETLDSGLKSKVKTIMMTEIPSGLKATLNLGDTSEKNAFADAGINTTDKKGTAASKISRAAVMIRLKK